MNNKSMVLIDDDELVRLTWSLAARRTNISISLYETIDEFIGDSVRHPLETPIFVDSMLRNGVIGESESKRVYDLGFKNLSITTAKSNLEITPPEWICNVVNKRFPFELFG